MLLTQSSNLDTENAGLILKEQIGVGLNTFFFNLYFSSFTHFILPPIRDQWDGVTFIGH